MRSTLHSFQLEQIRPLRILISRLRFIVAVALVVAAGAVDAIAEEASSGVPAGGGKSWAIPWLIVVLAVALGVFITLRPSGREAEIKRDMRPDL